MNESQWVELIASRIRRSLRLPSVRVETGFALPYGYEIASYGKDRKSQTIKYQTDLLLIEDVGDSRWKPRVVVEAKIRSVNTHDAITYSQKAIAHRGVHPYLRYGIMLGDRQHYPLPGRLYRHGTQFDFMLSFKGCVPTPAEWKRFLQVLRAEIRASQTMEEILYESRRRGRTRYTVLHRKLEIQ